MRTSTKPSQPRAIPDVIELRYAPDMTDADSRRSALKAFMSRRKLKPAEWARRAKVSSGSLYNFLNGHSESMSQPTWEKLARAEKVTISIILGESTELPRPPDGDIVGISIPELDVRAGMGGPMLTEHNENGGESTEVVLHHWELPKTLIHGHTSAPDSSLKIITAYGDSMAPGIEPGAKLLVDASDRLPTPPGIFVVFEGLGVVVKRVHHVPFSDPPRVVIESDNPKYPAYERTVDEAYIQGRVIGRWQWT